MHTERYGLLFDYVWEREYYLVGSRAGGWIDGDLNELDVKMLRNQSISGILPMMMVTQDMEKRLYYTVSGKKPLSVWMRTNHYTQEEAARLLYRLASILEDCRTYLLNEQQIILDDEFIYMGEHVEDVSVVYLPVKLLLEKPAVQQEFRQLADKLLGGRSTAHDNVANPHLRSLFSSGTRPLTYVKQGLMEAIAFGDGDVGQEDYEPTKQPNDLNPFRVGEKKRQKEVKIREPNNFKIAWFCSLSKRPLAVVLTVAVLMCLMWLLFVPTAGVAHVCLGLALLTAAGVIVMKPESMSAPDSAELKLDFDTPRMNSTAYYQALPQETHLLYGSNATVLLSEDAVSKRHSREWLEWQENGQTRQTTLDDERLTIGRSEEAKLRIDVHEVSRSHAEIEYVQEIVYLVDLGSTNGTFRNGERLIPYKRCPLEPDDRITIAGKEYIFKKFPPRQGFPS